MGGTEDVDNTILLPVRAGVDLAITKVAGKAIRWAVGSPDGPRGAAWRFWSNKKGDFYLSGSNLGGVMKASLHKDGRCQIGLTKESRGTVPVAENLKGSRHWDLWTLPDELKAVAIQVIVPGKELRTFPSHDAARQITWLPTPSEEELSVVTVFIVKGDPAFDRPWDAQMPWNAPDGPVHPLAFLTTPSRAAWIVHARQPISAPTTAMIEDSRKKIADSEFARAARREPSVRAMLFGARDGIRFLVELAWAE